jgi:hypothetical protein
VGLCVAALQTRTTQPLSASSLRGVCGVGLTVSLWDAGWKAAVGSSCRLPTTNWRTLPITARSKFTPRRPATKEFLPPKYSIRALSKCIAGTMTLVRMTAVGSLSRRCSYRPLPLPRPTHHRRRHRRRHHHRHRRHRRPNRNVAAVRSTVPRGNTSDHPPDSAAPRDLNPTVAVSSNPPSEYEPPGAVSYKYCTLER